MLCTPLVIEHPQPRDACNPSRSDKTGFRAPMPGVGIRHLGESSHSRGISSPMVYHFVVASISPPISHVQSAPACSCTTRRPVIPITMVQGKGHTQIPVDKSQLGVLGTKPQALTPTTAKLLPLPLKRQSQSLGWESQTPHPKVQFTLVAPPLRYLQAQHFKGRPFSLRALASRGQE